MGRDIMVFSFIDHVQQCAEEVFGLVDAKGRLEVNPQHRIAILDYDIKAKRAAFNKETFDCGVCLGRSVLASRSRAGFVFWGDRRARRGRMPCGLHGTPPGW
jgi:hypothetical protein